MGADSRLTDAGRRGRAPLAQHAEGLLLAEQAEAPDAAHTHGPRAAGRTRRRAGASRGLDAPVPHHHGRALDVCGQATRHRADPKAETSFAAPRGSGGSWNTFGRRGPRGCWAGIGGVASGQEVGGQAARPRGRRGGCPGRDTRDSNPISSAGTSIRRGKSARGTQPQPRGSQPWRGGAGPRLAWRQAGARLPLRGAPGATLFAVRVCCLASRLAQCQSRRG